MAVNKVAKSDGTTLIDITPTTALEDDVAEGKIFFRADGERGVGRSSGSSGIETENIVSEQSVNCSISLGSIYGGFINEHSAFPENQNYYLVTLDGVDYIARAYYQAAGYLIVGDNRINQGADYAYVMFPFAIVHEGNYFYLSIQTSGVHTLKIDKVLSFGIS